MSKQTNDQWGQCIEEIDAITREFPKSERPLKCLVLSMVETARMHAASRGLRGVYSKEYFERPESNLMIIGGFVEDNNLMLRKANEEAEKSKENLQKLLNDIRAMNKFIAPELIKLIKEVRTSRMEVTTELQKSLSQMRDLRKFFLESEHKDEMARLKEFVALAEQMKALIKDGTLEAISDIILKLEMREGD